MEEYDWVMAEPNQELCPSCGNVKKFCREIIV